MAGADAAIVTLREGPLVAMEESVQELKSALERVTPTGPGHFGGQHLRDSYRTEVRGVGSRVTGRVFTSLPQGRWVEDGTKAHEIWPRDKKALKVGDRVVGSVKHHPATAAQHIKERAEADAYPTVIERFRALVSSAIKEFRIF
jgi:hypothetical protein